MYKTKSSRGLQKEKTSSKEMVWNDGNKSDQKKLIGLDGRTRITDKLKGRELERIEKRSPCNEKLKRGKGFVPKMDKNKKKEKEPAWGKKKSRSKGNATRPPEKKV